MRLISLNIEGEKHIEIQKAFFNKTKADVICLQEIFEATFLKLKEFLGMDGVFIPMWKRPITRDGRTRYEVMGIATFSRYSVQDKLVHYYHGNASDIVEFVPEVTGQDLVNRALLVIKIKDDYSRKFVIANTHFTWSHNGRANIQQKSDLKTMLKILSEYQSIIFCGDFNAPRGGVIFNTLAQNYTDWIPKNYTSSIDGSLHYAGYLNVMVDGLFSTRDYKAKGVKLIKGVSDHCAVFATVERLDF